MQEYVLVSPDPRRIEVFRRAHDWRGDIATLGQRIIIHGVSVEVEAVFR